MLEKWQFNENLFAYVRRLYGMSVSHLPLSPFRRLVRQFHCVYIRTQYNNSCDANVASFQVKAAATVASTGNTVDRLRLAVRTHTQANSHFFPNGTILLNAQIE